MITTPAAAYEVVAHRVSWGPKDAVLWLFVAFASPVFVSALYIGARYGGEFPDERSAIDLIAIQPALWVAYLAGPWYTAAKKGAGAVSDFGFRFKASDVPVGLVAGVLTQIVVIRGLYFVIGQFADGDPSAEAKKLADPMSGVFDWGILAFAVVVMAPLAEEFFFRGILLRSIQRRLGPTPAILISGLVFAAVHLQPLQFPGLLVVGLLAAWFAVRTGRLGLPIMFHLGFNAAGFAVLLADS